MQFSVWRRSAVRSSGPGGHHTSWSLLYLHQRRLGLGQPERHIHGTEEVDSCGQCGTSLLPLADLGEEGPETQVAMRLQRAHANFLSQGKGLAVVAGSLVDVRGLATPGDLTEETAGMRLIAASCMGVGGFEEAPGKCTRLLHTADEQACLTQLGEHERMEKHTASGDHALQRLVQEREGIRHASGQGVHRTQEGGEYGNDMWEVGGLTERQAPVEH